MTGTARAVEIVAVVQLTLMGVSHIVRHRAWAEFFIRLRTLGHTGVFLHGFLSLALGALILGFHPVWSGLSTVLSVLGVLYVLKSLHCFLLPEAALRSLNRVSLERSRVFVAAGMWFLKVAAVTTASLIRG